MGQSETIQQIAFKIIADAGAAKSLAVEALTFAKKEEIDRANAMLDEAREHFNEAHRHHLGLIQDEAKGNKIELNLIFMHAEDQLMSTETILLLIEEMIEMYQTIQSS